MADPNFQPTAPQPLYTDTLPQPLEDFADTVPPGTLLPEPDSPEFKKLAEAQKQATTLQELLATFNGYAGIPLSNPPLITPEYYSGDVLGTLIAGEINKGEAIEFDIPTLPEFSNNLKRVLAKSSATKSTIEALSEKNAADRSTIAENIPVKPVRNFDIVQTDSVTPEARTTSNSSALTVAETPKPSEKPQKSGMFRASEGTVSNEKELLGMQQRSGKITSDEYFAKMAAIDARVEAAKEAEKERKRKSNVNKPSIISQLKARLIGAFSRNNTAASGTQVPEQIEPTFDTVNKNEIPVLTQTVNAKGESIFELANKVPDITDVVDSRFPEHNGDIVDDLYASAEMHTKAPVPAKQITSKPTPQEVPVLKDIIPESKVLSLTFTKKATENLTKEQVDALLKRKTSGLTQERIDDLVDVAIANDIKKLKENKRLEREASDKKIEDLFNDGFEAEQLELAKKKNLQERLGAWKNKLKGIADTTKGKIETATEKMGPEAKKLVSLLTRGSEYLNSSVDKKTKLFAAAGLLSAGALAAYATPVVLASMATVGLGMRVVSAAKMYTFTRKILDTKYEKWEKDGKQKSALTMMGMEAGAIGFALIGGELIGRAFDGIMSSDVVREVATSIRNNANIESVTEAWSNLFSSNTIENTAPDTSHAATEPSTSGATAQETPKPSALENVTTPANPELQHIFKKGDSLWSLLRGDLANMKLEGLEQLSQGAQERMMREILDDITVPSGNINKIFPGESVDFNEVDFKKYIAKYLRK